MATASRVALAFLGLLLLSCGSDPPSRPATRAVELSGQLSDSVGASLPGRPVTLRPAPVDWAHDAPVDTTGTRSDSTDSSGHFTFRDVEAGSWVIESRESAFRWARHIRLVDGSANVSNVVLELRDRGSLSGRVLLDSAVVHAGTRVTVLSPDSLVTLTTDDGSFRLDGVPIGPVAMAVTRPGWQPTMTSALLELAGDSLRTDTVILLSMAGTGRSIAGLVDNGHEPLAGVTITLTGPVNLDTRTDDRGVFLIRGLPQGSYIVRATRPGHQEALLPVDLESPSSPPAASLHLHVRPFARVAGRVTRVDGEPAPGSRVRLLGTPAEVLADGAGEFEFSDLQPGTWTVEITGDGYVSEQRSFDVPDWGAILELAPIVLRPGMRLACLQPVALVEDEFLPPNVLSAPRAITITPDGVVFILDTFWNRVQKFGPDGTFLGYWPVVGRDITAEPSGNLLISSGNFVDRYRPDGTRIGRFTSVGTPPFPGRQPYPFTPMGLALDPSGRFYATDSWGRVHKFTPEGQSYRYPQIYSLWDRFRSIAAIGERVFLESRESTSTSVYDSTLKAVGTIAGPVHGLESDGQGGIYVLGPQGLTRHFDSTLTLLRQFGSVGTGPGQFRDARSLARGHNGRLYVADFGNARVQVLSETGAFIGEWIGRPVRDYLQQPQHVTIASDGQIYVSNNLGGRISRYDPDGRFVQSVVFGPESLPRGLAFDRDGRLFVVTQDYYVKGRIKLFDRDLNIIASSPYSFSERDADATAAYGLTLNPAGGVYATDLQTSRILEFDAQGALIGSWSLDRIGSDASQSPRCISTSPGGDTIYVTDGRRHYVQGYDRSGHLLLTFGRQGSGPGEFSQPTGIAVDHAGNVYVSDLGNRRVQVFRADGAYVGEFDRVPGDSRRFVTPTGLAFDPERRRLHIVDAGLENVRVVDISDLGCP